MPLARVFPTGTRPVSGLGALEGGHDTRGSWGRRGRPLPAAPTHVHPPPHSARPSAQSLQLAANGGARGVAQGAPAPMRARGCGEGRGRAPTTPGLSAPITFSEGGEGSVRPGSRRRRLRSALGPAAAIKCLTAASCLSCFPACCFGDWTPAQVALPSLGSPRRHPLPRRR